jgi:hypothetical protein
MLNLFHLRMETDPVSETLCCFQFLEYQTMEMSRNPSIPSKKLKSDCQQSNNKGIQNIIQAKFYNIICIELCNKSKQVKSNVIKI